MGLMPIYQKSNTNKAAKGHKIYRYLLRGLRMDRPNQVWCADTAYLPMRRGFLYLVAIMNGHTRKVLSWRISNTLEAEFCLDAVNEAIHKFGLPDSMNTDHGSQFTSFAWTDQLRRSMDAPCAIGPIRSHKVARTTAPSLSSLRARALCGRVSHA